MIQRVFNILLLSVSISSIAASAEKSAWRFDCGTKESPVANGFIRLTAEQYNAESGFGWETPDAAAVVFGQGTRPGSEKGGSYEWTDNIMKHWEDSRTPLNTDGVASENDLIFRADVPNGLYRVVLTVGDMGDALGSMDLYINDVKVEDQVTAWAPKCYRMLYINPGGWWRSLRHTIEAKDGVIRLRLTKNQTTYDRRLAEQAAGPNPFTLWQHNTPILLEAPYSFIGAPFVRNSVMAVEIVRDVPAPVTEDDDILTLDKSVESPALAKAIELFNSGEFAKSAKALEQATEPEAQTAKATVLLYLAGRLEYEQEKKLVPQSIEILKPYVESHPEEQRLAEFLEDAEIFQKGMTFHLERGLFGQRNHFEYNDMAMGQWVTIREGSPLYWKALFRFGRTAYMLKPYKPMISTEKEIFEKIERKHPENRFAKYFLHREWAPYGDGSNYDDWFKKDYSELVKDSPAWVQSLYPAWAGMLEWAEWFAKYKQTPGGTIGGGWGDDVEVVGSFGYYGFTSQGASDLSEQVAHKLVEGMWFNSEIDPELGFCGAFTDAEHATEWTGNTVGMMCQLDYGNPVWIERAMKTGKLLRDHFTGYDKNGHRRFKSTWYSATEIGTGHRAFDSWINYRGVRPATAVVRYNRNPTIGKIYTEIADAWVASSMSTDRGKPRGVIPANISFPEGLIGGVNSPNWWTTSHIPGSGGQDWPNSPAYKSYVFDVLVCAYNLTGDLKYIEPIKAEYELAAKYDNLPPADTVTRMEIPPSWRKSWKEVEKAGAEFEPGTEPWVGAKLTKTERWLFIKKEVEKRRGPLKNDLSKDDIIKFGDYINGQFKDRWPLMTTESSATDRVDWGGSCNAFFIYTGGRWGGNYWLAPITYRNTTRLFAAAVMGQDPRGFRLLYHSLAPKTLEIEILPWELQAGGKYLLKYGPDANEDEIMDSVSEEREFTFPQAGTPIKIKVNPRLTYVVEVQQTEPGKGPSLAPDPALTSSDISYDAKAGLLTAAIHNIGAKDANNVKVAFFAGDPEAGGKTIGETVIEKIEAPNDLEPRIVNASVSLESATDIEAVFVIVDPDNTITDEITTLNNKASLRL
jgi:tetratricopeptide (TPR) repeat protein